MPALPDILIRASAGTGKTYRLASRFIQLLEAGVEPASILAATFTRKAAGEILERILLMLARAATDADRLTELANSIGSPELSQSRCLELLTLITQHLHRLQIGTLDSFFSRLASSFSLELGLPPGWRILDDLESKRMRQDAIEALLEASTDGDLVSLLRLLTRGTAARSVSELILNTVETSHEVAVSTPTEAWKRVPRPTLPTDDDVRSSRQDLEDLIGSVEPVVAKAIKADIELAEREQWDAMLKAGILPKVLAGERKYNRKELDEQTLAVYGRLLKQISAILLNRWAWQNEATRELLDRFDIEYRSLQRRHGGCTFSDVARALANRSQVSQTDRSVERESIEPLAFRLDSRLSHILLDEFQDTSPLQWSVLQPFAVNIMAKSAAGRATSRRAVSKTELPGSFFCVGDVKQAIYGWRGGDARIFETLSAQLPNLKSEILAKSRRSAQPIITTVNQVFRLMPRHPDLGRCTAAIRKWCEEFPPHTTVKQDFAGYVQMLVAPAGEDKKEQNQVTLGRAANLVADLVRKHPARSIGVLTRSNLAVGRLIFELQSLGIPASEEGGNPLTDSAAVQLIVSLLRLADHPGDTIARAHVAMSPLGSSIGLLDWRDDRLATELSNRLRQQLLSSGYGPSVTAWVQMLLPHCNRRERSRLKQLTEEAFAFQATASLRTRDFIDHVESVRIADPSTHPVRVMTVHQSKGLQFDIVVLPELDTDLLGQEPSLVSGQTEDLKSLPMVCVSRNATVRQFLPNAMQKVFDRAVDRRAQEALCVLYVALTRAVHAMYILIAPSEKPPSATFAGLVRAALSDNPAAPADQVLFEQGESVWDQSETPKVPGNPIAGGSSEKQDVSEIRFAVADPSVRRDWLRESPSQSVPDKRRPLSDDLIVHDRLACDIGILFHRWFEEIDWLNDGAPSRECLLTAAQSLPPLSLDPAEHLPRFLDMLSKPCVRELLTRGDEAGLQPTVLHEHPVAVRKSSKLTCARIDRLVVWKSEQKIVRAELLDFKTGPISPAADQWKEKLAEDQRQMTVYRELLCQELRLPLNKVAGTLIYVDSELVVSV